jgi:ribosome maturation factor RimP
MATTTENQTQTETSAPKGPKLPPQERLIEALTPLLDSMGYELVHLELVNNREKTLRLYIDIAGRGDDHATAVGIEDCVKVTRALDEPLEGLAELDKYFGGAYELEVSSPGVDRPLRKPKDFARFSGSDVRIHTFRPLTADELANVEYQKRNPKQKNYLGVLEGWDSERESVKLGVLASMGAAGKLKKGQKLSKKAAEAAAKKDHILIPVSLISKANIEPDFDLDT